ncbi:PDC sensor domain-containing protein [Marinobacter sp. X15-166B]|uniref:PDC sensor domain-containing protein n=1 Tax=Marinobacter sp. X15-166B TaxID=1897620 RepID=UPI00085BD79D|nr:PDC sensor domain-containing protein [Marinobacter sp. X15-166B]OEY65519.1 hypothetical protein BG841_02960 [Marinobacter sp. X15-166B]
MAFQRHVWLASILALTASALVHAQAPTINLYTFDSSLENGQGADAGIQSDIGDKITKRVICAANKAGWHTNIKTVPPKRALYSLRNQLVDGYFAISASHELAPYAIRSEPIALEKWYLYSRLPDAKVDVYDMGTVAGSNEERWLERNGYRIKLRVSAEHQLLALLFKKRIDTAVFDEARMAYIVQTAPPAQRQPLYRQFLRFAPMYLYVSYGFAAQHPGFLKRFNHHLRGCGSDVYQLNDTKKTLVRTLAQTYLDDLMSTGIPQAALSQEPGVSSFTDILAADSTWHALAPEFASRQAVELLARPASRQLAEWQRQSRGVIREVFITDDAGTLVASSQLTSNFWMGNRDDFKEAARGESGEFFIDPIHFDSSSGYFVTFVTTPLRSPSTGRLLGLIAFAIDAETIMLPSGLQDDPGYSHAPSGAVP